MSHGRPRKRVRQSKSLPRNLKRVRPHAAGIDVGSEKHFVAVPEGSSPDGKDVASFGAFTSDLFRLAAWLRECRIRTVAMESTGVYWIALYELLENEGFEVHLVDARQTKNVTGRKSDVLDCQWIQTLHTYGLLTSAFRPDDEISTLRGYLRHRATLVASASRHIQRMQKALTEMNLKLQNVVSDITGVTGMKIITAIIDGNHDPHSLAKFRDRRCKRSEKAIAEALHGTYRREHLFALKQSVELYQEYAKRIQDCDREIHKYLETLQGPANTSKLPNEARKRKPAKNDFHFDARSELHRMTGVDLTRIEGVDANTALNVIGEIGTDMTRWPTVKHFGSWIALSPGTRQSGTQLRSSRTKRSANRAATALRLAARSLANSKSALGAFYRRKRAQFGAPKAITATAHKLARIIYNMLRYGTEYVDRGHDYYEREHRKRVVSNLHRRARQLGYKLVSDDKSDTPDETRTM